MKTTISSFLGIYLSMTSSLSDLMKMVGASCFRQGLFAPAEVLITSVAQLRFNSQGISQTIYRRIIIQVVSSGNQSLAPLVDSQSIEITNARLKQVPVANAKSCGSYYVSILHFISFNVVDRVFQRALVALLAAVVLGVRLGIINW